MGHFESMDIYLNSTLSEISSMVHFDENATRHSFVIMFPESAVIVDLYDMKVFLLDPRQKKSGELFIYLILL